MPTQWQLHALCGMSVMQLREARGAGHGTLHNRPRQSEITALCHLWLCVVVALDKTKDRAQWRISARSVTDFSLDRDGSDSLRSIPVQSQYKDRCIFYLNNILT